MRESQPFATLRVKVIPGSKFNKLAAGPDTDCLKIHVTAKPISGKANQSVINLLSKKMKIKKSSIQIISGEKNREKTIRIDGIDEIEFKRILSQALSQEP